MTTLFFNKKRFLKAFLAGLILILLISGANALTLFDDFEDGEYTTNPVWNVIAGTAFSVDTTQAYHGSYGLNGSGNGELKTDTSFTQDYNFIVYTWCKNGGSNNSNNWIAFNLTTTNPIYTASNYVYLQGGSNGSAQCYVALNSYIDNVDQGAELIYTYTTGTSRWTKWDINFSLTTDTVTASAYDMNGGETYLGTASTPIKSSLNEIKQLVVYNENNTYYRDYISYGVPVTPNTNPFDINVTKPYTGKYSGTIDLNFTIRDSNRTLTPKAKLYYSSTSGAMTNLIYSDTNLLDGVGIDCNNYNFTTNQTCHYNFNTTTIADANYYIDLNVFNTDWNAIDSSTIFEVDNYDINANFNVNVNKPSLVVDLNNISTTTGATQTGWRWLINGVQISTDQNTTYTATEYQDINACLAVGAKTTTLSLDINSFTCRSFNAGKVYGDTNFWFFDESTNTATSATIDFNGTQYTGTSFYLPSKQITNNSPTDTQIDFNISKAGYGTRHYSIDMNQFTDLNVGFLVLKDANGINFEFKFFQTDQTTILKNAEIIVKHAAFDANNVGRTTTDAEGKATFFLNPSDGNYQFLIKSSTGTNYVYKAISLTVLKPKAEDTGLTIDANWNVSVSGLGASSDVNITAASKVLAIYSDTVKYYIVSVSSNNVDPEYYDRSYELRSQGNQAMTLQPYLVTTDDATQVKLVTKQDNGAVVVPYANMLIKIYKLLPLTGRSLIEQVITDAKGEALVYLNIGDTYEFEVYDPDGNWLEFDGDNTPNVKVASATVYITIDTSEQATSTIDQKYWAITAWNPSSSYLTKLTTGTRVFGFTIINPDGSDMNIISVVTQNDTNFRVDNNITSATSFTVAHPAINWSDINKGVVQQKVIVRVDGNVYIFIQNYNIQSSFGGYYDPITGLKEGIRTDLGCSTTGYCLPTMVLAIVICTTLIVFAAIKTRAFGGQGTAILFAIGLSLFTYLTWVPLELTIVVVLIVAAFVINERGQRGE